MAPRYELAVGLDKGHKTTKIRVARDKSKAEKTVCLRPSRLKGVSFFFYIYRATSLAYAKYGYRTQCTKPFLPHFYHCMHYIVLSTSILFRSEDSGDSSANRRTRVVFHHTHACTTEGMHALVFTSDRAFAVGRTFLVWPSSDLYVFLLCLSRIPPTFLPYLSALLPLLVCLLSSFQ